VAVQVIATPQGSVLRSVGDRLVLGRLRGWPARPDGSPGVVHCRRDSPGMATI